MSSILTTSPWRNSLFLEYVCYIFENYCIGVKRAYHVNLLTFIVLKSHLRGGYGKLINCDNHKSEMLVFTLKVEYRSTKYTVCSHCMMKLYASLYTLGETVHWARFWLDLRKKKETKQLNIAPVCVLQENFFFSSKI